MSRRVISCTGSDAVDRVAQLTGKRGSGLHTLARGPNHRASDHDAIRESGDSRRLLRARNAESNAQRERRYATEPPDGFREVRWQVVARSCHTEAADHVHEPASV